MDSCLAGTVQSHHTFDDLFRPSLEGNMKSLHIVALSCFALAMVFYLTPWPPAAMALAAFGAIFEIIAWVALLKAQRSTAPSVLSGPTPFAQTSDQPANRDPPAAGS
jgi:hypothetical protein